MGLLTGVVENRVENQLEQMIPTESENNGGGAAKQGRKRVISLGGYIGLRVSVAHPTANVQ